ncbi:MAG TPA: DNA alkylation repair protein [Desulfobulbaceae bacterium]|nr:DNA alkylation repair protein [Desulfobulbaceae bacterium]
MYDPDELEQVLARLADPEIALHSARFFKTGRGEYGEGDKFLGIRVPQLRKLVPRCRRLSLKDVQNLLCASWHEKRLLAALILVDRFRRGTKAEQRKIFILYVQHLGIGINNWDIIDTTCPHIVGAWLYTGDRSVLYELAGSENLWQRRAAMLACFHFIRKNDFKDVLNIASLLLEDREDLIHKASGWMLREIGKKNQQIEEDFLRKYCRIMPRTMLRYAVERFAPELRKQYMDAKKQQRRKS